MKSILIELRYFLDDLVGRGDRSLPDKRSWLDVGDKDGELREQHGASIRICLDDERGEHGELVEQPSGVEVAEEEVVRLRVWE